MCTTEQIIDVNWCVNYVNIFTFITDQLLYMNWRQYCKSIFVWLLSNTRKYFLRAYIYRRILEPVTMQVSKYSLMNYTSHPLPTVWYALRASTGGMVFGTLSGCEVQISSYFRRKFDVILLHKFHVKCLM